MKTGEIAEVFDVTRRTINNWKSAGCPCVSGGRGKEDAYDSAEVHRWLVSEAVEDGAEKDPEIKAARLEILRTEVKLRELKLEERKGALIETESVEFAMKDSFVSIRTAFRGFIPWLGGECLALAGEKSDIRILYHKIDERIDQVIFSVYVSLSRALADLAGRSEKRAAKMAAATWKESFGTRWEDEFDRLEEIRKEGETTQ